MYYHLENFFAQFAAVFVYALPALIYVGAWLNFIILPLFVAHRIAQIEDPHFETRVTYPTHTMLSIFSTFLYGILVPFTAFTVPPLLWGTEASHDIVYPAIKIPLLFCTAWLVFHWLRAVFRSECPRYTSHWFNRLVSIVALILCAWLLVNDIPRHYANHYSDVMDQALWRRRSTLFAAFTYSIQNFSFVIGATIVYALALRESFSQRPKPWSFSPRIDIPAAIIAVLMGALVLIMICPVPIGHRSTMNKLQAHRALIIDTAEAAELDPALLASIIYVGQRENSIAFIDSFSDHFFQEYARLNRDFFWTDRPLGFCKITPHAASWTFRQLSIVHWERKNRPDTQVLPLSDWPDDDPIKPLIAQADIEQFYNHWQDVNFYSDVDKNIATTALTLCMLKRTWEERGSSLEGRPALLATLFKRIPQHITPHHSREISQFGKKVLAFMQSEACQRFFPEPRKQKKR